MRVEPGMRVERGMARAVAAFRSVVGPEHVVVDRDVLSSYATDWTGRFVGHTEVVVRPASTEEVAAIVSWCAREGIALTLQGGNTGLVGGSVPLCGEAVLSLGRLGALAEVDPVAGQVTAGAGVPVAAVQRAAQRAGWTYGVDLASRDSATVGGTVATNAGGLRMLRYGNTRSQLLGIEAVLGDGSLISHLGGLLKDNTGYDLAGLLCGSEGTLGVVTAARLRLVPRAPERSTALVCFGAVADAVEAGSHLRRWLPTLEAAELVLDEGLSLVCREFGLPRPFAANHPVYLLVEAADTADPTPALADAVDSLQGVRDVAVAVEPERRDALWRYREGHTEAVNRLGAPHKLDVSLPSGEIAEFVRRVPRAVASLAPSAEVWIFGHVADGNVHVNVTGLPGAGNARADGSSEGVGDAVDDAVFRLAAGLEGSISAEHGIGVAKRRWLRLNRTPAEIDAFRALRHALDPAGILSPNVLVGAS